MNPIRLPSNPRILVVVLRRLGDVLLTTPLIHSVKRAYPDAAIEALVFAGTEGILAGNPDLAGVIAMPQRPSVGASLALFGRLARRYALALSVQPGDRPTTWPAGGLDPPWAAAGTIQHRGNVWLVQNPLPCLPCQLEGCERRIDSHSQCLDELTVSQVMAAVDQALAMRQAA